MSDAAIAAGRLLAFWLRRIITALLAFALVILLAVTAYAGWVWLATRMGVAAVSGTRRGIPVERPVTIARDARGVPHVRASSAHDLFVAEGYAMASDRLFQMDLSRRFVYGRLAEMLGDPLVRVDRRMRLNGIHAIVVRILAHADPDERAMLAAFADGVNAAAAREPVPPEYRALFWRFEPWKPEDALAVGFATVLDLDDTPDDVIVRDEVRDALGPAGTDAFYPLTDPAYDVPTDGSAPGAIAKLPALPRPLAHGPEHSVTAFGDDVLPHERDPVGSNAWAFGANRTTAGRAVLANDPHLDIGVPAIWWVFEGSAPGIHIAGAALAGTPGVTLGHNDHLAWAVTAGESAAMRVYREHARDGERFFENGAWVRATHRHESVRVRFGRTRDVDVERTPRGIVIGWSTDGKDAYVMRWAMQATNASPLAPFTQLLRARTSADGIAAMRALPEPALNVVFADDAGNAAYHFAGRVPLDPEFGRWANSGAPSGDLQYDAAPHVDPSRDAAIVTSNNRPSAAGPRLAPYWPPPYRAYELRRLLSMAPGGARPPLAIDAIAAGQRDDTSPAEGEFARLVAATAFRSDIAGEPQVERMAEMLATFNGDIAPNSQTATIVVALRRDMAAEIARLHLPDALARAQPPSGPGFEVVLRMLRERPRGWVRNDDYGEFVTASMRRVATSLEHDGDFPTFGEWAAQPLKHPLAPFGFRFWNGPTMTGHGGSFAPAVQWNGHAQSFRALWIAGDWDHGTIDVDAGESGEPGSPHYHDQTAGWERFARTPLPFSDAAVRAATVSTLTLTP